MYLYVDYRPICRTDCGVLFSRDGVLEDVLDLVDKKIVALASKRPGLGLGLGLGLRLDVLASSQL